MKKYLPYLIITVALLLGLYKLRCFIDSPIPLGYDPGMYKGIFAAYTNLLPSLDFTQLPSRVRHEPLLGLIMGILGKIGVTGDWLITRGIGLLSLLPGVILLLYFWKKNRRIGIISACLRRISITQYQLFWRGYLKQVIGISLMLGIFWLTENKKYIWGGLLFFLLLIFHKHTALYTGIVTIIWFLREWRQTKQFNRKWALCFFLPGLVA